MHEITLTAGRDYGNYYTDVTCWVELEVPDFSRRVYGFWDGGNIFKIRMTATKPVVVTGRFAALLRQPDAQ